MTNQIYFETTKMNTVERKNLLISTFLSCFKWPVYVSCLLYSKQEYPESTLKSLLKNIIILTIYSQSENGAESVKMLKNVQVMFST